MMVCLPTCDIDAHRIPKDLMALENLKETIKFEAQCRPCKPGAMMALALFGKPCEPDTILIHVIFKNGYGISITCGFIIPRWEIAVLKKTTSDYSVCGETVQGGLTEKEVIEEAHKIKRLRFSLRYKLHLLIHRIKRKIWRKED